MTSQDHDPVRDLTLLMMVRLMPEDDFLRLCEIVRKGGNTQGFTLDRDSYCKLLQAPDSSCKFVCDCCGEPITASPETANFLAATDIPACKACIDEALAAIFGPDAAASFIARHAFSLILADRHVA
jgi:hypothetical protein